MMTHSLLNPAAIAVPIPTTSKLICNSHHESQSFPGVRSCLQGSQDKAPDTKINVQRRIVVFGLVGAVVGVGLGEKSAMAGKRAPPPPPVEKKDPNITGLAAKVLANKKRKEAMQQEVARLRSKGKPVQ